MQRHAVTQSRHAKLADTEIDVVARGIVTRDGCRTIVLRQIRTSQVGRASNEFGQRRCEGIQCDQRRLTSRHICRGFVDLGDGLVGQFTPGLRQNASHSACKFCGEFRVSCGVSCEQHAPLFFVGGATFARIPGSRYVGRNFKWRSTPSKLSPGCSDLFITEWRTVRRRRALLVGRAETDNGLAANERRLVTLGDGLINSRCDG